jgi:hypothetical protein
MPSSKTACSSRRTSIHVFVQAVHIAETENRDVDTARIAYHIPSIVMLGIPNITPFAKHMINPVKLGIPNLNFEIKVLAFRNARRYLGDLKKL